MAAFHETESFLNYNFPKLEIGRRQTYRKNRLKTRPETQQEISLVDGRRIIQQQHVTRKTLFFKEKMKMSNPLYIRKWNGGQFSKLPIWNKDKRVMGLNY